MRPPCRSSATPSCPGRPRTPSQKGAAPPSASRRRALEQPRIAADSGARPPPVGRHDRQDARANRLWRAIEALDDRLAVTEPPFAQPAGDLALHVAHQVDAAASAKAAQGEIVRGGLEQVARPGRWAGALVLRQRAT